MDQLIAARDDVNLVPVIDLDVAAKSVNIAKRGEQARLFSFFGAHYLTAPGNNAAVGAAFVILAGIVIGAIEVGLWSTEIPFRVAGDVGHAARLAAGTRRESSPSTGRRRSSALGRFLNEAAVLNAAVDARALTANFGLKLEVAWLAALPDQIDSAGWLFACGFG